MKCCEKWVAYKNKKDGCVFTSQIEGKDHYIALHRGYICQKNYIKVITKDGLPVWKEV